MISEGTSLLSLVAALVGLTLLVGGSVAIVEAAFAGADREPAEQALAQAYSDQAIAHAALSPDRQVIAESQLQSLNRSVLGITGPPPAVEVRLDGTRVYQLGDAIDGTTIRRLVVVNTGTRITRTGNALTIPAGVQRLTLGNIGSGTVRADGRVVAVDTGTANRTLWLDPTTPTTLRSEAGQPMTVWYDATADRTAVLSVTVEVTG